ncbi:cation transporter, partial [Streptomyces sp. NPDC048551]
MTASAAVPESGGDPARGADPAPHGGGNCAPHGSGGGGGQDAETRKTVWVALAANLAICGAKAVGGVVAGSPALLSEAAHSIADSLNEVFLLASLKRSRRPADAR